MIHLKRALASLIPFAILELFFYFIRNGWPVQLSDSLLTFCSITTILICTNAIQMILLNGSAKKFLLRALQVNSTMWGVFWFLYTVDGFTVHTGLAKDAERSVSAFLIHFGSSFLKFGIPLTLF